MQITISNYRGCIAASIKGAPILIVGGKNGNGKSSLLEGVALAVTGWGMPPGVRDGNELLYTNDEGMRAAKGMVSVFMETGARHTTYPNGKGAADGDLKVSPVAAGLVQIPTMKAAEIAREISPFVQSEPTLEDLLKAFKDQGIDANTAGIVWEKIGSKGWDKSLKQAQERGAALKAQWQTITGQRWGTVIGDSWRPEGWDDALLSDATTDADVAALKDALETAQKAASFSEGVMATLKEDVAALEARKKAASDAQAAEQTALNELHAAEKHRNGLQNPDDGGLEMPCPECGAFLMLLRKDGATTELKAADPHKTGADALKKMRKAIAEADGDLANKRTAYTNAKAAAMQASTTLQGSRDAVVKFNEANATAGDGGDVAEAQAAYDAARDRVAKRQAHANAKSRHTMIVGNAIIQDILAPEGLRATALKRGLEAFNADHLAPLCDAAGWPHVLIADDLSISYGGRAYRWLSGSQKWITNAVLQIAVARADGSQMVILDGADICDAGNRNKLFALLTQIGIEALIGMTFNKPGQLPALAENQLGERFWMREGKSEEIVA